MFSPKISTSSLRGGIHGRTVPQSQNTQFCYLCGFSLVETMAGTQNRSEIADPGPEDRAYTLDGISLRGYS
jgi:hypothetical protein